MEMEYRRLGKSGLKVSALSFGAWITMGQQIGEDESAALMKIAYDAGVNFFDNAETYADGRAEEIMGRVFRKFGWPRDSFVVSSKVYYGSGGTRPNQTGLSRKHVIEACHDALRRLQVDHLDLYFCHRPDPDTPVEETVRAMHDLIVQGKVLYWGTSEWGVEQIQGALAVCARGGLIAPSMEQPRYNLFHRQRFEVEYSPLFREHGIGATTWSPLAGGLLTGKYNRGMPEGTRATRPELEWLRPRFEGPEAQKRISIVQQLAPVAQELGTTLPRLAIAWCMRNPRVSSVILGASQPGQLKENLGAPAVVPKLTTELMAKLDAMTRPVAFK